ncbi:hypothetical protein [Microcoleus sp. herbarium12]
MLRPNTRSIEQLPGQHRVFVEPDFLVRDLGALTHSSPRVSDLRLIR